MNEFGYRYARYIFALVLFAIVLANVLIPLGSGIRADTTVYPLSSDPWLNENWAKRRLVTINNSNNSSTLENYQILVNVTYDNDMLANFGDLRFCDNDRATELPYWIENYNARENAVVWVKIPSIPANDNYTIYMYYGNPGAETRSDGSAVFEFFDNFDNTTKFSTVEYPYGDPNSAALPNFVEFGNNGNEEYVKLGCYDEGELRKDLNLPFSNYKIVVKWRTANDPFECENADFTNYDDKYGASIWTPKRLIVINENKIHEKDRKLLSYSERTEVGYTGAIDNFYISVGSSGSENVYFTYYDFTFIRKSTDPEPITSVGEEESNIAPTAPSLLEPRGNAYENDPTPLFRWENSIDPEGDSIRYTLQIDDEASFSTPLVYENIGIIENQHELPAENALLDGVYYWRVGARDMVNSENWSEAFVLTIDTTSPPAPTLVSPENNAVGDSLTQAFRWTEPEPDVTYDIQIDDEPSFTPPHVHENIGLTENSYSYTFTSNGTYYWRVRAEDMANNYGPWADYFKLIIQVPPPSQPTLYLPATGAIDNDNTPYFEWTVGENADNHRLLVDNDPDLSSPIDNVLLGAADNTWAKPSPGYADGTYYWRVIAINVGGENGSNIWNLTIDTLPPLAPTLLEPENGAYENYSMPTFRWSEPEALENYTLVIDNDADFGSPTQLITDITDNTFVLSTPLPDGVYYWRVRGIDAAGNQGAWSESFTLLIDTVAPLAPSLLSPADGTFTSDNTPAFAWGAVTDPSGLTYDLQVDNDPDFSSPEVKQTSLVDNTYTSTAELVDENYSWRVRAVDGVGNVGEWSVVWTLVIDTISPEAPTLVSPENGASVGSPNVLFTWAEPEPSAAYHIQIDDEASFTSPHVHENITIADNSYSYTFARVGTYYWRVRARDKAGNLGEWSNTFELIIEVVVMPGTPRDPIYIENDNFFNLINGVVTGTGAENDPYIIENWSISASTTHGIWIKNTTAYFIIRNCLVENGGTNYYGIYLINLVNGKVENCMSENNIHGIYLRDSTKLIITNNICSNNHAFHGILLENSSNNTIANNTCSNNAWYGITLNYYSSNNTLTNNNCFDNPYGIYLRNMSDNNIVLNNTCSNNAYGIGLWNSDNDILDNNTCSNNFRGICLVSSGNAKMRKNILANNQYNFGVSGSAYSHFVHDIDTSNIVNGKPIRYLLDNKNEIIGPSLDVGYLGLVNCDNVLVENLPLKNNYEGILLAFTRNSWVRNCTFENNFRGINMYSSDNNYIYHNNFVKNENQALDDGSNYWDDGYPSGGNYWSDYRGGDNYRGENQDIPGGDGIGDTPYFISGGGNVDRYPFMNPWPPILRVKASISPSFQGGPPGTTLTYKVDIVNTGTVDDTYNLTVIDNAGWNPILTDNLLENVAPGGNRVVTLIVTIPDNENLGVEDKITVVATSRKDNTLRDEATCTAHAAEESTFILGLNAGWNLVGFPLTSTNTTPDNLFRGLTYTMYYWVAPNGPYSEPNKNLPVEDNCGYWVKLNVEANVTVCGMLRENRTIYFAAGWNLVHFPLTSANTTPDNIFAGLTYTMYYWEAPYGPLSEPNKNLPVQLGVGYWVKLGQDYSATVPL
jgi:parallel beta-helix repeat protein